MRLPRYANVTSTLALFAALSGGAYAATALPAKSVGPTQLKKNAVVRSKIKKNAVDSSKIKNNAINGVKVAADALTGADIKETTLEKVPAAALADGASHANSSAALDKITYKTAAGTAPPGGGAGGTATAACDPGQHVVGGGLRVDDPTDANILDDYPDAGNTAWTGRAWAASAPVTFTVFAICMTATATG
jgi:hypothetical protein